MVETNRAEDRRCCGAITLGSSRSAGFCRLPPSTFYERIAIERDPDRASDRAKQDAYLRKEMKDVWENLGQFGGHVGQETDHARHRGGDVIFQQSSQLTLKDISAGANANTTFHQEATGLVDQAGPVLKKALPCPVQGLKIELLRPLQSHEGHGRARCGLRDGFGVLVVGLVKLHGSPDIQRRHQAWFLTLLDTGMTKVVGPTARLHRHDARWKSRQESLEPMALDAFT